MSIVIIRGGLVVFGVHAANITLASNTLSEVPAGVVPVAPFSVKSLSVVEISVNQNLILPNAPNLNCRHWARVL